MKYPFQSLPPIFFAFIFLSHACSSRKDATIRDTPPLSGKNSKYNFVAVMEVKEDIPGICDKKYVLVILPLSGNGQVKAKAPKTDEQLTLELNEQVTFLKDKPDYEDKGIVNMIINCKGDLVKCQIDNKTKSPELDSQIVAVFSTMKKWVPGTHNNRPVDTADLCSFEIKNGKFTLK